MLRFEFICPNHPEEVLDYEVWSEGDPVQIAIQPCPKCANEQEREGKAIRDEMKDQIAEVEIEIKSAAEKITQLAKSIMVGGE